MRTTPLLATPFLILACAPLDQPIAAPPINEPALRGAPFRDSPIYGPPMTEPGQLKTVKRRMGSNHSTHWNSPQADKPPQHTITRGASTRANE